MDSAVFQDTIQAASTRARDCRARLEQLRSGGAYSDEHVRNARERLDNARRRTALALERVGVRDVTPSPTRAPSTLPSDVEPPVSTGAAPIDVASFAARLNGLEGRLLDVWISYAALGGRCSLLEVDAAVHGALLLTDADDMRIDQALWERENDL